MAGRRRDDGTQRTPSCMTHAHTRAHLHFLPRQAVDGHAQQVVVALLDSGGSGGRARLLVDVAGLASAGRGGLRLGRGGRSGGSGLRAHARWLAGQWWRVSGAARAAGECEQRGHCHGTHTQTHTQTHTHTLVRGHTPPLTSLDLAMRA
jgi:hypothetical protein